MSLPGLGRHMAEAVGHDAYPDWGQATVAMVSTGDEFAPEARAARAYPGDQQGARDVDHLTDPLFGSMADGLQGLRRAPGPGRG